LKFAFLLTSLLLTTSGIASPPAARRGADVVLVTIDTLRADHLGCYGDKLIKTPNIDGLAADGARFENAFAVVPVTLPSHTSIMTGTYPMYTGMHDFSGNKLNPQQATLGSVLRGHGYATGAIIGAAVLDSRFGLNNGFDLYYDHFDVRPLEEADLDLTERPGNQVMDLALNWIKKNSAHPFFIWIHLYDPHYPYNPPAPYNKQYKDRLYDGEIAFADAQVGRLTEFLKRTQLYSHTMIALTGDHGEGLGEHGEKTHGFFIYNSTMHVPLIFKLPGVARPRTIETAASLVDIMPTILDALGVSAPAATQGHTLLAELEGKPLPEKDHSDIYGETFLPRIHFNWSELRGIEIGKYHFIDAPKPEMYDLSADPGETKNLYSDKKAVSTEYRSHLDHTITRYSSDEATAQKTGLDPELAERLKSLGYAAVSGGGDPGVSNSALPDPKDRIQTYELISEAIEESQHGEYAPSAEKLKLALKTEPSSVPINYLLGMNYFRMQQFGDAIKEFQTVMRLSPDYALAAFQLGLSYASAGQPEEAVTYLAKALQLDGTNFSAAFNLGAAYLRLQDVPHAAAAFRQAIAINPGYMRAHAALGQTLLYENQLDPAIAEFREAIRLEPQAQAPHLLLAKALEAKGFTAEAQEELHKAQGLSPNQ
jgi:arylsulfatase A-like enzyme/Flp pilus assembly protein TadD